MKELQQLTQEFSRTSHQNLLSIFLDVNNLPHHEISHHLNSFLTDQKHHHPVLAQHAHFIDKIIDQVSSILNQKETPAQSLAIYAKLNTKTQDIEFLKVVNLRHQIQNQLYLNHVFDMLPLIRDIQRYPAALLIQIDHHQATLFEYTNNQLTQLDQWTNDFIDKREKEYIETTGSPTQTQQHGTGTKRYELANDDANLQFINQILQTLQTSTNKTKLEQSDFLLLFHTPNINQHMEMIFQNTYLGTFSLDIIKQPKIFATQQQLQTEAEHLIQEAQQQKLQDTLKDAQEQNSLFTTDWHQIIQSTNQNRTHKLFLDINAHKPGFINQEQQIQLEKPEEQQWSESTNIIPWITHQVYTTGGEVYIFEENGFFEISQIAALLRY